MKKSNNKTLRFDTQKNVRSSRTKRFVAAFSCFFVLLAGISFLFLLSYYDFNLSAIGSPPAEESTTEQVTQAAPQVEGEKNFLLFCTADSDNTVYFAAILHADMNNARLSLTPLDPDELYTASGVTGTLSQQLDSGAEKQLIKAIETKTNIPVDKFVRSTENSFKALITAFGGYTTKIHEAIDIRSDKLTVIINEGEQTLTGDTLLRYIRSRETPEEQAEILADLISKEITDSNFAKADSLFSRIVNTATSNISVLDFARIKTGIEALLYNSEIVHVFVN